MTEILKRLLLVSLVLASTGTSYSQLSATCSDAHDVQWQTITNSDAQFTIKLPPCDIDERTETQLMGDERVNITFYIVNLQDQPANCLAYTMSYRKLSLAEDQIEDYMTTQAHANAQGTNSSIEILKKLDGWDHAMEYILLVPENMILRHRMIYENDILYAMAVVSTKDRRFNKSITKFLKSFELVE